MSANNGRHYDQIAVALQGGGSLGAYHIGALDAMQKAGYAPDVVAGISIGAFTAAIVAGNEPKARAEKLKEFWHTISWPDVPAITEGEGWMRKWHNQASSMQGFVFGQPGFFRPRPFPAPMFQVCGSPAATSFYDTDLLFQTLPRVVDFDRINHHATRLILGATRVRDGAPAWFDNDKQKIGPEHVMASGAMPPGFPGVRIDGELYWDGGCYSNTPLEGIYDRLRDSGNTLCFVIDLFGPNGREPQDMDEVQMTMKEIQFSNRIKNRIRALREIHTYAHYFQHILKKHKNAIADHPHRDEIEELMKVGNFDFVHVLYQKPGTEVATCDCEFSRSSIEYRSRQGYSDMKKALDEFAGQAEKLHRVRELEPIGSVEYTFSKGMQVGSSFDTAGVLARAKAKSNGLPKPPPNSRHRATTMKVRSQQPSSEMTHN